MENRLGLMLLCLTFRTSANQCGFYQRQQSYHLLSEFNNLNMINPQFIIELAPRTQFTCARECYYNNNCTMFDINSDDGQCLLFSAFFPAVISSSTLHGAKLYARVSATCPLANGYVTFDNPTACYRLSLVRKTWMDAKADCEGDGGHLVVLEDVDKQQQVMEATAAIRGEEGVYVGLDDIHTEGTYKWADGRNFVNTFWDGTQPSPGGNEDCMGLHGGGLHDFPCDMALYYVCQIDMMGSW